MSRSICVERCLLLRGIQCREVFTTKKGGAAVPTLVSGSASGVLQPWPSPGPSRPPWS